MILRIGRPVWYFPPQQELESFGVDAETPVPAIVSSILVDRRVNIGGFRADGAAFLATNVLFLDGFVGAEARSLANGFCMFPPP